MIRANQHPADCPCIIGCLCEIQVLGSTTIPPPLKLPNIK